ncbi:YdcF family protein [Chelativorans salis]|uniref:YdcF family protein n=1 Tax=Chelativorans salis TaxID=2978478 RepID=A0ABT2LM59_9HYPH|nr:YdcF family protein [Chelativorans sp. EGI FJ00035]MCT7375665.1 YdcF family protein [Chelativorans sp. EGI FJ00035]
MFHLASAVFWTLIQPVNLTGLLVAASLTAALLRWRRLSVSLSLLGLLVLGLSGWTTLGALFLHPLENRFQQPAGPLGEVDGIIVLGGGFEGAINLVRGGYELNASGDRFVEAAVLARRYPGARLVISGGSGSVFLAGEGDADTAPRLLTALGVAPGRIEMENRSRDTYENAQFSKRLVAPQPGETWLLVTSAFHMPRAVGAFRQADFPVVPWPVDYKTSGTERFGLAADNVLDSLRNTTTAMREWLGLLAYWLAGRTDRLLPVPD